MKGELLRQDDELSNWVRTQAPDSFWLLASADYRLVAAGRAGSHIVVTREQPAPSSRKNIKLPDACSANTVRVVGPFEFYAAAGLRLS